FPSVSNVESELQGFVTWTRYIIPQHLNTLLLKIHGMSEDLTDTKLLTSLEAEPSLLSAFTDICDANVGHTSVTDHLINSCQNSKMKVGNIPNGKPSSSLNGLTVKYVDNINHKTEENSDSSFKCGNTKFQNTCGSDAMNCETNIDIALLESVTSFGRNTNRISISVDPKDDNFKRKNSICSNHSIDNFSSISTDEAIDEPYIDLVRIDVSR
ncbi:unnamed protein product, partial [Meganyctiphanes norvegica]